MPAKLKDLATAITVVAEPETTAARAAGLMRQHHVGSIVVVDAAQKEKPVGIITDRDLVLAVMAEELDARLFTVGDVMSMPLITAHEETDLLDAVNLLGKHCLRRLVVVDDAGRLTGIATLEDLLEGLTKELMGLALAVRGARDREFRERR